MEHTPLPEDVIYVPSVEELEAVPEAKTFSERVFGGLPIQIGYCNGNNHKLNAVEYHRNSEINIAVTDMILLLGWLPDVTDEFTYDTAKSRLLRFWQERSLKCMRRHFIMHRATQQTVDLSVL